LRIKAIQILKLAPGKGFEPQFTGNKDVDEFLNEVLWDLGPIESKMLMRTCRKAKTRGINSNLSERVYKKNIIMTSKNKNFES
jgi:hypothetical protein